MKLAVARWIKTCTAGLLNGSEEVHPTEREGFWKTLGHLPALFSRCFRIERVTGCHDAMEWNGMDL